MKMRDKIQGMLKDGNTILKQSNPKVPKNGPASNNYDGIRSEKYNQPNSRTPVTVDIYK